MASSRVEMNALTKIKRLVQQGKVMIPTLVGAGILSVTVGAIGFGAITYMEDLSDEQMQDFGEQILTQYEASVVTTSDMALQKAATLAGDWRVISAATLALTGAISKADDKVSQEARGALQSAYEASNKAYEDLTGRPMRAHLHLNTWRPDSQSLAILPAPAE